MKKIIALLTAGLVLVAALSGCAGKTAQSMDGAAMPQTQTGVQTLSSKSEEQTTLEDNYEFSSEILAEPNDIRYTDVPGMPTQDFVLSFEDVKNEKTYDVTVEEPDKLTSNALSDIYNFVQTEQRKPVRYFDEEVQKAVEELLPNGVSVDILHMTEFMQVLLEKTEDKNSDAKATVIIDADYVPNRLVIVMIGDRQACKDDQDLDAIEWTPLKASVTEVGKIEFVLPAELLEKVEGDDIIFSVLTDRIGTHGGVIHYKDGEIIITYPSKTAEDTGRIFKDGADAGRSFGDIASAELELSAHWLKKQLISSHRFNSLYLKAFRREVFNGDTTDYSCFYGTHCGEDKAQLLYPVTNAKKIWYLPDRLYQYHQRTDSTMHQCRPDTISRMMAGEMFTLLYQFMQTWGMTEPADLEEVAVYYLKNYLSVYYNCRKCCTAKERQILRQYPWNKEIDKTAMRYFFSSRLTVKERAKLLAALARA